MNGVRHALHGSANMDTLVALSTSIAFLFSFFNTVYPRFWYEKGLEPHVYYEASGVIIAFVLLGKLLEERAKNSTSSAIKSLMGLQPKTARRVRDGQEEEVSISFLRVGDLVSAVRPVALSFTGDIGGRNSDILNWFIRFYLLSLQALIFMNQVIGFQCYKV